MVKFTNNLREKLDSDNSFREFRINFGNNNHFIAINIDYLEEEECVAIKLYEPLPINYSIKNTLDIHNTLLRVVWCNLHLQNYHLNVVS